MNDEQSPLPEEQSRAARLAQTTGDDDLVRTYEARYQPARRPQPLSRSRAANISDEERQWAAIAHASIWVTMLGGLFTVGFIVPMSIFIPLVVYFLYRKRSDFVAFHALQAFVLQLLGTVGVLALAVVGGAAWALGMVIALLAIFVLAGFVLVPVWGIVGILLALLICFTPLAALLFGTIAAVQTYNRADYRYPFVARWVDRQLSGSFQSSI